MAGQTPWQTVGPFFHFAMPWPGGADLVGRSDLGARPELTPSGHFRLTPVTRPEPPPGQVVEIVGQVWDGAREPLPDALVEIWQADPDGRYAADPSQGFVGFGRAATDSAGGFRFRTLRPGRVPGPGDTLQAAHIAVGVMGRGLMERLVTRLYFEDGEGLDEDPVLALVPEARRGTLLARRAGPSAYLFDIVLQGPGETVFFDF